MKECGIEERVFKLELNLTETEQMTCGILDHILGEDIADELIGVIDTAYEAGQEALVGEILEDFDEYVRLEEEKCEAMKENLLWTSDEAPERRYLAARTAQMNVEEMMRDIFGDDTKIVRIKDRIYMEIGRVQKW